MADIQLPQLPDTRSTQRLLNVLRQLEDFMANGAAYAGQPIAGPSEVKGELARLRRQNRELKTKQKVARERLDALLTRLQSQPATPHQTPQQENAA